ncbi:hypothetical protein [uncultured Marinobacter sp.]|uniref:hypothetical protein n=1 Tax=uncultured Marinobacter sp. TaxID=187379 RepID=UPI002593FBF1|nr:hypothetical protein [uncultured Marinobacter sp.]
MGFQTATATNNVRSFDRPVNAQNDQWKSDAFINLYVPTRQGGRRKLGSVGLKLSKPMEKQILDFLADSGEEGLAQLKERLVLDFQRADGQNGDELDLG